MRSTVLSIVIAAFALILAGCRQADGPMPTPNAQAKEDMEDIRHDVEYIANGHDPQAPQYLNDDLTKYARRRTAVAPVEELSRRVATALPGAKVTEQNGQRLAHSLWESIAAIETSERQVQTMQNDMQALLVSMGIAEDKARQVAAQVGEVQRAVNDHPRRWYELF